MEFLRFTSSDICFPVIKRRVIEELADFVVSLTRPVPWSIAAAYWNCSYPNGRAAAMAESRLYKKGWIARTGRWGESKLELTARGLEQASSLVQSRPPWSKRWDGYWYLLTYDIPEIERRFRDSLRKFLKHRRMGCLHQSVWVSPQDVRSDYYDLCKTLSIQLCSYMFRVETVLGQGADKIVSAAWDFERLLGFQRFYLEVVEQNLERLNAGASSLDSIVKLAKEEMESYLAVMSEDPFLPQPLWPVNYLGYQVWLRHREFRQSITEQFGRFR